MGILEDIGHFFSQGVHAANPSLKAVEGGASDVGQAINDLWGTGEPGKPTVYGEATGSKPDAPAAKPKAKKKASSNNAQTQQLEQQIASQDDFNKLSQGLVSGMQAQEAPLQQAVSGQLAGPAQSNAVAQALSAAGLSADSPAATWLNANIAQGNANDAPMMQAQQAYGQAAAQGNQGFETALANMGSAEQLGMQTAPEQTWLQALAQHIQSNLNYYGTIPNWAVGSGSSALPPALQYYLQTTGTGQATGTTPLQSIAVPGAPKPKASGLPATGSAPGVAPGPGNPNTPGA